jgi:hypothetical protein
LGIRLRIFGQNPQKAARLHDGGKDESPEHEVVLGSHPKPHPDDFLSMIMGCFVPQSQEAKYSGESATAPFVSLISGAGSGETALEYSPPRLFLKSCF